MVYCRFTTKPKMGLQELSSLRVFIAVLGLVLNVVNFCDGKRISTYVRASTSTDMPQSAFPPPPGANAPEQVHITQGDHVGTAVLVSWITPNGASVTQVYYWTNVNNKLTSTDCVVVTYTYYTYKSGYIHHCNISGLQYNTQYYYQVGKGSSSRTFFFTTPPAVGIDVPYTFGLIGDLGQTYNSNTTLTHYQNNQLNPKAILYLGDLSYADDYPNHDNTRWDTWGRFVERVAAYQPWIWNSGNHEVDFAPSLGETKPFKPYSNRFHTPYNASGSTTQFWYSIKRASAYIIVLASYSPYGYSTPQYSWAGAEFKKVNRSETPWLIVTMHAPWYNSYVNHYMEGEPMRVVYESLFVKYKVDAVYAGHVHAYERSERVSNIQYNITNALCTPTFDQSAPVYITVGDGGNLEGLGSSSGTQPSYSVYREPSYGHAILDIKNRTHAFFGWFRNQDGYAVEADSLWLFNRYWYPVNDSVST